MEQGENSSSDQQRRNLPPLQTKFTDAQTASRWRRSRPVIPLAEQSPRTNTSLNAPLPSRNLEHRQSKMSLFNLFSKPKVERARGFHESGMTVPIESPQSPPISTAKSKPIIIPNLPNLPPQPTARPVDTVPVRPKTSRLGSMRMRQSTGWDPPPLFQAFPQSIKHAKLHTTAMSPEYMQRNKVHKRQISVLHEKIESGVDQLGNGEAGAIAELKRQEKEKSSHKRLSSASTIFVPELEEKIYVLVTSGYVLQYANEGSSDRLPEKILQLGKDSAAFASDLIPGKHWVLQISQASKEDGTIVRSTPARSLLSKFRLPTSGSRKTANSFLLVLGSAEEMGSWLSSVRKQIESLGGMKFQSDPVSLGTQSPEHTLEKTPSHRFNLQREKERFESESIPASPVVESPTVVISDWRRSILPQKHADTASIASSRRVTMRKSVDVASLATTVISNDQVQLNQLREGSRLSYMSSGTAPTSRGTSPAPPTPSSDAPPKIDVEQARNPASLKSFNLNLTTPTNLRRRSMATLPTTSEHQGLSVKSDMSRQKRHSTYGPTNRANHSEVPISSTMTPVKRPVSVRSTSPTHTVIIGVGPSTPAPTVPLPPIPPQHSPPKAARPQSTLGSLPASQGISSHGRTRQLSSSRPSFRPVPIRPQTSSGGTLPVPKRLSSLGAPSPPPSIPPPRLPSISPGAKCASTPYLVSNEMGKSLRRPTSMQIRSDPAPFLSSSRPNTAYNRSVSNPSGVTKVSPVYGNQRQRVQVRRSMPVLGLPPPPPPPNMPLPTPPSMPSPVSSLRPQVLV